MRLIAHRPSEALVLGNREVIESADSSVEIVLGNVLIELINERKLSFQISARLNATKIFFQTGFSRSRFKFIRSESKSKFFSNCFEVFIYQRTNSVFVNAT